LLDSAIGRPPFGFQLFGTAATGDREAVHQLILFGDPLDVADPALVGVEFELQQLA
jgi:hypothetical protein